MARILKTTDPDLSRVWQFCFFFNDTATTEISTLSLHDALPIYIQQNQAAEITANLRPNPTLFTDWEYLPVFSRPQNQTVSEYLQGSTEGDIGLSYLIERGNRGPRRLEAARSTTAVTRSQVADNERGTAFQVGSFFINA